MPAAASPREPSCQPAATGGGGGGGDGGAARRQAKEQVERREGKCGAGQAAGATVCAGAAGGPRSHVCIYWNRLETENHAELHQKIQNLIQ